VRKDGDLRSAVRLHALMPQKWLWPAGIRMNELQTLPEGTNLVSCAATPRLWLNLRRTVGVDLGSGPGLTFFWQPARWPEPRVVGVD